MTSVPEEIITFIQSFPRSKNGFIILDENCRYESDPDTIILLNMMYMGKGTITLNHLKAISVSDKQEKEYNEEEQRIAYEIEKYEKRIHIHEYKDY
jgi:hypothetical protein